MFFQVNPALPQNAISTISNPENYKSLPKLSVLAMPGLTRTSQLVYCTGYFKNTKYLKNININVMVKKIKIYIYFLSNL